MCACIYIHVYIYIHRNECPWSGFVNIYIYTWILYVYVCIYGPDTIHTCLKAPPCKRWVSFASWTKLWALQDLPSTMVINHLHPLGWILQVSFFQTPRQGKAKMPCNHLGLRHKNTKVKGGNGLSVGHHIIWAHMTPGPKLHAPDFFKKKKIPQKIPPHNFSIKIWFPPQNRSFFLTLQLSVTQSCRFGLKSSRQTQESPIFRCSLVPFVVFPIASM